MLAVITPLCIWQGDVLFQMEESLFCSKNISKVIRSEYEAWAEFRLHPAEIESSLTRVLTHPIYYWLRPKDAGIPACASALRGRGISSLHWSSARSTEVCARRRERTLSFWKLFANNTWALYALIGCRPSCFLLCVDRNYVIASFCKQLKRWGNVNDLVHASEKCVI